MVHITIKNQFGKKRPSNNDKVVRHIKTHTDVVTDNAQGILTASTSSSSGAQIALNTTTQIVHPPFAMQSIPANLDPDATPEQKIAYKQYHDYWTRHALLNLDAAPEFVYPSDANRADFLFTGAGSAACIIAWELARNTETLRRLGHISGTANPKIVILEQGPNTSLGNPENPNQDPEVQGDLGLVQVPINVFLLYDRYHAGSGAEFVPTSTLLEFVAQGGDTYTDENGNEIQPKLYFPYPRAHGAGGCCSHHAMQDGVGPMAIYNEMSEAIGDEFFHGDTSMQYLFRKMENYTGALRFTRDAHRDEYGVRFGRPDIGTATTARQIWNFAANYLSAAPSDIFPISDVNTKIQYRTLEYGFSSTQEITGPVPVFSVEGRQGINLIDGWKQVDMSVLSDFSESAQAGESLIGEFSGILKPQLHMFVAAVTSVDQTVTVSAPGVAAFDADGNGIVGGKVLHTFTMQHGAAGQLMINDRVVTDKSVPMVDYAHQIAVPEDGRIRITVTPRQGGGKARVSMMTLQNLPVDTVVNYDLLKQNEEEGFAGTNGWLPIRYGNPHVTDELILEHLIGNPAYGAPPQVALRRDPDGVGFAGIQAKNIKGENYRAWSWDDLLMPDRRFPWDDSNPREYYLGNVTTYWDHFINEIMIEKVQGKWKAVGVRATNGRSLQKSAPLNTLTIKRPSIAEAFRRGMPVNLTEEERIVLQISDLGQLTDGQQIILDRLSVEGSYVTLQPDEGPTIPEEFKSSSLVSLFKEYDPEDDSETNKLYKPKDVTFYANTVFVCAGAIQSPQLMQLSGVGDGGHLASVGVQVKVHSPGVGSNISDHTEIGCVFRLDARKAIAPWHAFLLTVFGFSLQGEDDTIPTVINKEYRPAILESLKNADGNSFGENTGVITMDWHSGIDQDPEYVKTPKSRDDTWADIHCGLFNAYFTGFEFDNAWAVDETLTLKDKPYAHYHKQRNNIPSAENSMVNDPVLTKSGLINSQFTNKPAEFITWLVELLKPTEGKTNGTVRLRRDEKYVDPSGRGRMTNPRDEPLLDENLYEDQLGIRRMARFILRVVRPAMNALRDKIGVPEGERYEIAPGPGADTEEKIMEYISTKSAFGHHISGTMRMGSKSAEEGDVLTPFFQVRANGNNQEIIRGLYCADTSFYRAPFLHGYNTSRAAYLAGEACAYRFLHPNHKKVRKDVAAAMSRNTPEAVAEGMRLAALTAAA